MHTQAPPKPKEIKPREVAYRALKRDILLNLIAPGEGLTELGLAHALGFSQGTIREALLRLQEDGLVSRNGHKGTFVTPLDAATAQEMLALRRQIETRAARASGGKIDTALFGKLLVIRHQMDDCVRHDDPFGMLEADIRFHLELFRSAGFAALESILVRVMLHTHRQKLWEPRHRRPLAETAARHDAIIAAISRGGEALAEALGQHIDTIVDVSAPVATPGNATAQPRMRVT